MESARSGQLKSLTERPMENMRVACVEHCKHARVPRGRQLHVYHLGKFPQACFKKNTEKSGACVFDATNHGLAPVQEHQSLRNALGPHPLHLYHHHHHNYILHTVLYFSHYA